VRAAAWREPLYTADEMREAEATYAGPTLDLMEKAGEAVAASVSRRYPDAQRISVWCGPGANGGDGLVVARLLHAAGRGVEVLLIADEARIRGDALENLRRAREAGVAFRTEAGPADVVVDALFGTGFSGAPRRPAAQAIEMINVSGGPVVAVDVPSGIDASTGEIAGDAVRASATVTFHGPKLGLVVAPGRFHAGEVEVADIGLAHDETESAHLLPEVLELVPRRRPEDNKYSAGSVLVVGGSAGFTGAVCLASEAALRSGAGIVFACVPASVAPWVDQRLLEVVTRACEDDSDGRLVPEAVETVLEVAARVKVVAIGPGLGRSEGTRQLVQAVLERLELPVVVDADALWALAGHLEWAFARERPTVLTPHVGELGRLLGQPSARVGARRLHAVRAGADDTGAVVLLKGADTLVAAPGRGVLVADLGNAGLATAGTGDVLTGIVAAFLAKGMEPQLAATAGAAAHGLAAGLAAERSGVAGMIASDLLPSLSLLLSQ
jgi:ADP-dependent NAD(P)H-hydrate dehydratase / NAD(P)H-hydrate epimerase